MDFFGFLKKYKKRSLVKKRVVEFVEIDFDDEFEDKLKLKFFKGKVK